MQRAWHAGEPWVDARPPSNERATADGTLADWAETTPGFDSSEVTAKSLWGGGISYADAVPAARPSKPWIASPGTSGLGTAARIEPPFLVLEFRFLLNYRPTLLLLDHGFDVRVLVALHYEEVARVGANPLVIGVPEIHLLVAAQIITLAVVELSLHLGMPLLPALHPFVGGAPQGLV